MGIFKTLGDMVSLVTAVGLVLLGAALFHFLAWWGLIGGAGLWLLATACVLRKHVDRTESRDQDSCAAEGQALTENLNRIEAQLKHVCEELQSIEYNTLSEAEKHLRWFENAPSLTLSQVHGFKEGHLIELMSVSDSARIEHFKYEHSFLFQSQLPQGWHEVHGFRRASLSDQSTEYQFLVSESEARTANGNVIKEYTGKEPHNEARRRKPAKDAGAAERPSR